MKTEFSRQIFEKSSHIKFHENPNYPMRTYGRKDGQTWRSYSRFSQFFERS